MSLINQMLQDIEARKVPVQPLPAPINAEVHAVVPYRTSYRVVLLLLALCAVAAYLIKGQANTSSMSNHSTMSTAMISEAQASTPATAEKIARIEPKALTSLSFKPMLDKELHVVALLDVSDNTPAITTQLGATKDPHNAIASQPTMLAVADTRTIATQLEVQPTQTETIEVAKVAAIQATPIKQAQETKVVVKKQMNAEQKSAHEYQMAVSYLQQGRVAEALDSLKKTIETNPQFEEARQTLIGLLIENKRNEEAMQYLKQSLAQSAQKTNDAQTLARLQLDVGAERDALATLETSQMYAIKDASYQGLMAVILQKQGRHAEAIQHYQLALQANASNPSWLIGMGVSMQAEGRNEEAKQAYQKIQVSELSPQLAAFVSQRLKQIQ
jgi:MSHA biogenesis protein MshN